MIDEKNPYLKPCPFCGESSDVAVVDLAHVHEGDCREDVVWERAVECQNCGAHGGTANTREGAVKSWNDRKNGSKVELIRVKDHDHDLTGAGK